jgi:hypothetical protein
MLGNFGDIALHGWALAESGVNGPPVMATLSCLSTRYGTVNRAPPCIVAYCWWKEGVAKSEVFNGSRILCPCVGLGETGAGEVPYKDTTQQQVIIVTPLHTTHWVLPTYTKMRRE